MKNRKKMGYFAVALLFCAVVLPLGGCGGDGQGETASPQEDWRGVISVLRGADTLRAGLSFGTLEEGEYMGHGTEDTHVTLTTACLRNFAHADGPRLFYGATETDGTREELYYAVTGGTLTEYTAADRTGHYNRRELAKEEDVKGQMRSLVGERDPAALFLSLKFRTGEGTFSAEELGSALSKRAGAVSYEGRVTVDFGNAETPFGQGEREAVVRVNTLSWREEEPVELTLLANGQTVGEGEFAAVRYTAAWFVFGGDARFDLPA